MLDLVARGDILDALIEKGQKSKRYKWGENWELNLSEIKEAVESVPSAEPERKWIPVSKALPENKEWYLGIFKESDTGYCISVPFVCYYAGRKTMITTKDYWILRGYDDIYSFSEYYRNLECAAWMPLPEPWRGE